jgi:hypothetical protein
MCILCRKQIGDAQHLEMNLKALKEIYFKKSLQVFTSSSEENSFD